MDGWWAVRLIGPPLVLLVVFSYFVVRRQRLLARLQERWGWLGASARHHQAGRAWSGEVGGRPVQVRWFSDNTEIEIEARPIAEVGFVRSGQPAELAQVQGGRPVELDGKTGYGRDRATVEALARQPGIGQALSVLLEGADRSLRAVRLDPSGRVSWFARRLPQREGTAQDARRWVEALLHVARASEQVPLSASRPQAWMGEATAP